VSAACLKVMDNRQRTMGIHSSPCPALLYTAVETAAGVHDRTLYPRCGLNYGLPTAAHNSKVPQVACSRCSMHLHRRNHCAGCILPYLPQRSQPASQPTP
jgi:uncharacterized paraquat-inducible protein A